MSCLQPLGDGDSAPSSVGGSGVPSPVSVAAADVAMEEVKEEKRPVFKDPDFQVVCWKVVCQFIILYSCTSFHPPPSFSASFPTACIVYLFQVVSSLYHRSSNIR